MNLDYKFYDLNELIMRAKNYDKSAVIIIIKKFLPYIYKMVSSLYIKNMDNDDLKQIGYVSVMKAIKNFNLSRIDNFTSYVTKTIRNNYYYQVKKISKEKYTVSLEKEIGDGLTLMDMIMDSSNLEDVYIRKEELKLLKNVVMNLSKYDKQLLKCFYKGDKGDLRRYAEKNCISIRMVYKRKTALLKKIRRIFDYR